jgi:hypothetical protein
MSLIVMLMGNSLRPQMNLEQREIKHGVYTENKTTSLAKE